MTSSALPLGSVPGRVTPLGIARTGILVALIVLLIPQVRGTALVRVPAPIVAPGLPVPGVVAPAKAGAPAAPAAANPVGATPATPAAPGAPAVPQAIAATGLAAAAAALAQAQRTGQPVPVSFTLSEAELTSAAARSFPQTIAGMTLSDPVIRLVPGSAQLVATTRLLFVTTQFAVSTTPVAAGGRVAARLDAATLGGVGLPDAARGAIVSAVESAIAGVLPPKLQVTAVSVAAGSISFQGTAQP